MTETPPAHWDEWAMTEAGGLMRREYPGGAVQQQAAIHVALIGAMRYAEAGKEAQANSQGA